MWAILVANQGLWYIGPKPQVVLVYLFQSQEITSGLEIEHYLPVSAKEDEKNSQTMDTKRLLGELEEENQSGKEYLSFMEPRLLTGTTGRQ